MYFYSWYLLNDAWLYVPFTLLLTVSVTSYVLFSLSFVIVKGPVYKSNNFFVMPCIVPVSYTHLDVYKRQYLYIHNASVHRHTRACRYQILHSCHTPHILSNQRKPVKVSFKEYVRVIDLKTKCRPILFTLRNNIYL